MLTRQDLTGRVALITALIPGTGDAGIPGLELAGRLSRLAATLLGPDDDPVRVVVLVLDEAAESLAQVQRALDSAGGGDRVLVVPPREGASADLAQRLGIVPLHGRPDLPTQSYVTAVIDRRGHIADLFPGLDGWSVPDLIASVQATRAR